MTEPSTDRLNELLDDYADSLEVNQAGFFAHPDSERRAARKALVDAFSEGSSKVAALETMLREFKDRRALSANEPSDRRLSDDYFGTR